MSRRITTGVCVALAICVGSCAERGALSPDVTAIVAPPGVVVSNALSVSSTSSQTAVRNSLDQAAATLAYVSASPGTFQGMISAALQNRTRNGARQVFRIVDGGFDPVGVDAAPGDQLSLDLYTVGPSITTMITVPKRRSPAVVRTIPAKGRTDVALSVQIVIVFSEPLDRASVNASSVTLRQNGTAIKGSLALSDDGLSVDLTPDSPLAPGTDFVVVVGAEIRDLDGDALGEPYEADFATADVGTIIVTSSTTAANSSDLDPDGYSVVIDGGNAQHIGINDKITAENLSVGPHIVVVNGAASNCTVNSETELAVSIDVRAGISTTVPALVDCQPKPNFAGVIAFVSRRDGNAEIYTINGDGTGLTRLTNDPGDDLDPSWSPDGKRIAFTSNRTGKNDIYTMNADGSDVVRRTNSDGSDFIDVNNGGMTPVWSPDGRKIAFSSWRTGSFLIYTVDVDGDWSKPTQVGPNLGYNSDPAWSPDGARIAFSSDWRAFDFVYDLFVMDANGSNITDLVVPPFFTPIFYFQPSWSPNWSRLAAIACRRSNDDCFSGSSIVTVNADGSALTQIVAAGGYSHPTWSPDGNMIAFSVSCRDCRGKIMYITADGKKTGLFMSDGFSPAWHR